MNSPQIEAAIAAVDKEIEAYGAIVPGGGIEERLYGPESDMAKSAVLAVFKTIEKTSLITDQEQLDAVPAESVLIDSYRVPLGGDVYRKSHNGTYWQAGPQGEFTSIKLPARVLLRGTE